MERTERNFFRNFLRRTDSLFSALLRNLGKRTVKKSKANPNGGMIERAVSVHVSNVNKVAAEAKSE